MLQPKGRSVVITDLVKKSVDGLETVEKVKDGIKNIVSHIFSKDTEVLEKIQEM